MSYDQETTEMLEEGLGIILRGNPRLCEIAWKLHHEKGLFFRIIAKEWQVSRVTVSRWTEWWERFGTSTAGTSEESAPTFSEGMAEIRPSDYQDRPRDEETEGYHQRSENSKFLAIFARMIADARQVSMMLSSITSDVRDEIPSYLEKLDKELEMVRNPGKSLDDDLKELLS